MGRDRGINLVFTTIIWPGSRSRLMVYPDLFLSDYF